MESWVFRKVEDGDLPVLHEWMNEPGVVRFWEGDDVSWPAIVAQYGSPERRATIIEEFPDFVYDSDGADFDAQHVEVYLGLFDGDLIGWIQCYAVRDYDDEDEVKAWLGLGFDPAGAGIDYLIGNPERRGRGIGSSMIRAFIDDVVFAQHPAWEQVGASPVRENVASCKALAKAGFELVGSFDDREFGPCNLYVRVRSGIWGLTPKVSVAEC